MEENCVIREGRKEDCQELRRLIQELADYQKCSDGPKIDHTVLEKDGYGDDNPLFYTYVVTPADDDTKLIGFALYFFVYSTWMGKRMHLEDLHIEEKYRRKGLGQRLFRTVAEKALKSGCSQMTWTCLNWNPAQEFYFKQGGYDYTKKTGEHNFRLERDGLEKLVLQN